MIIGVPVELSLHERRVALVPAVVPTLVKAGLKVLVQRGAGEKAGLPDAAYEEQGANLATDRSELFSSADILLQVGSLNSNPDVVQNDLVHSGQIRSEERRVGKECRL